MGEWAIQVVGDTGMVERLKDALGSDARTRVDGDATFLIRPEWQGVSDSRELEALGRAFLNGANGLMRIRGGFVAPLRFGGVVYLGDGGARTFYDRLTGTLKLTGSVRAEVIRADGTRVAPPPDPLGDWLPKVQGDDLLRESVSLFGDASDWPDLWKVYELARVGLGGQRAVDALIGKPTARRLTQTINHYRHARGYPLPTDPFNFDGAAAEIAELVEAWLRQV